MAMLGSSCSPCCDQCGCQPGESLPDAVAVTFNDLPDSFVGEISTGGTANFDCAGVFDSINGVTVTLPYAGGCTYAGCIGDRWVKVIYQGRLTPPTVELGGTFTDGGFGPAPYFTDCPMILFTADPADSPFECGSLSFTASNRSATAVLSSDWTQLVSVTVPSGSVTVSPATGRAGRCWSALSDAVPNAVTVEITGAEDRESRLKLAPIANAPVTPSNRPGVASRLIDRLEFLNGVYDMQYSGQGNLYGGCNVHIWEYCFPSDSGACGGKLRLFLPKYVGGAWLEFVGSNAPRVRLTAANTTSTPAYLEDIDECPPFYETNYTPPGPPPNEIWKKSATQQSYGFAFNIWPANGFCVDGDAQMEFGQPFILLNSHTPAALAYEASELAWLPYYESEGAVVESQINSTPLLINVSARFDANPVIALTLKISSCFGVGAAGVGQAEELGPVLNVTLKRPGSGYAKLGRREPALSIAGMAATFSLSQQAGACDLPYWKIDSISVPSGVGGFTDGQAVTVSAIAGDTVEVAAQCTVETERAEPALTASASPGTGAVFSVEMADNEDGTWRVSAVTFTGTTAGYEDGGYLSFSGTSVTEEEAAAVMIVTGRDQPEMSLEVYSWGGGAGAVLTPTVSTNGGTPETWGISAVAIDNGGEGYSPGDDVYATGGIAEPFSEFYGSVASVDENGAITGVHIYYGGMYYETNGVIDSLYVVGGGRYYIDQVAAIVVVNGGRYYREDATLPPIVADVVVSVVQPEGSSAAGAVIEASVNQNTSSPEFGEISGLTLVAGGSGYTTRRHTGDCESNPFP